MSRAISGDVTAQRSQGDESEVAELVHFHKEDRSPLRTCTSESLLSVEVTSAPLSTRSSARSPTARRLSFLRSHPSFRSCGGVRHMTRKLEILDSPQKPTVGAVLGAIVLCANTIVGAGTLAVPFTMSLTGFVTYHVIVVLVLVVNFASLRWLVDVAEVLPKDVPRNYEGIAHHFFGGMADVLISAAMVFGGFALTMAYMLFITTSLTSVLVTMNILSAMPKETLHTGVLFSVGCCFVLPLMLLKDISRLQWTSALAVVMLASTTVYVIVSSCLSLQSVGVHRGFVPSRLSSDIFDAVPMSVGAYACQILVLPIYDSLGPGRTPALMGIVLVGGLALATFVYEGVGVMGYLQFGEVVQTNILQNLISESSGSLVSVAVSFGMALTLICHVPVIVWPLRSCLISAYHYTLDFEHVSETPSDKEWYITSAFIMGGVLGMAALFPEIKTALSVVGSVGGACIVFIYPAAFHLAVVKQASFRDWFRFEHFAQVFMMLLGLVFGVLCFAMSVRNTISK